MGLIALGAWEWGPLMGFAKKRRRLAFVLTNIALVGALWFFIPPGDIWSLTGELSWQVEAIFWLAVAWWIVSALLTILYPRCSKFWSSHRSVRGLFGWLTLIPTWLAFMALRASDYTIEPYHGAQLLLALFIMVWAADIGAYFAGKSFGKHKLMPNVSPGKTMEGMIGGIAFACLIVAAGGLILSWTSTQFITALCVTAGISIVSVLGDLSESMLKRQAGVKDSGTILPGHGGILDRIDSLTATAPVFALCYALIGW